ncbi:Uncharacterized protein SCF082_LOCUS26380 [Durusdinium trenchii]|uniref:Uncharacterized protein n=1 Tax=Durusdinium trenchii TaxID=1381693 RepID=A0ABP0M9X3_9DINO
MPWFLSAEGFGLLKSGTGKSVGIFGSSDFGSIVRPQVLDSDGSKFITLDMWDPPSYRALMEFRHVCFREYGGLLEAFRYALDLDGSGTCRKPVLAKFLANCDYTGDVEILWNALDEHRGGFITVARRSSLAKSMDFRVFCTKQLEHEE